MSQAPGKIILFGEHAVVYGQPAIAVPFGALTAFAEAESAPPGSGLTIRALDTSQIYRVKATQAAQRAPLIAAAQLVLSALDVPPPDLAITLHSTIPIASGLGSGAAVATALMRELSQALGQPLETETLNQLVYEVEKLHHGTPSGIDNTVIVYGCPVYFTRGQPLELLTVGAPIHLIVADSGIGHSTRETVADVRRLRDADPARIDPLLEQIGAIVKAARQAIESGESLALGPLMTENQRILTALGVSSPALDQLIEAALGAGALGAKLSGGGRGGNVIALVRPEAAETVGEAMRAAGAVASWQTTVQ